MLFSFSGLSGIEYFIVVLAMLLVTVLSLSLHEFAHAFVAYKCGDETPKLQGRVTLNPLKHMDVMGFICCLLFGFGWAKPVQINPSNFRNVKKGQAWTSVAGVLMNLILGFLSYGLYCLMLIINVENLFVTFLATFFYYMFFVNIALAVFNFLPIYPLDGFRFVETMTKYNNGYVRFMYKYGNIILILFVIFMDSLLIQLINLIATPIILFWGLIF